MNRSFILISLLIFIGSIYGDEQLPLCTCKQQSTCFEQIKDNIEGCIKQCEATVNLKSTIDEFEKVDTCINGVENDVKEFYDCLENECSLAGSCSNETIENGNEGNLGATSFMEITNKIIRPFEDKLTQKFEDASKGLQIPFVQRTIEMNKCSKECAFKNIDKLDCFVGKESCAIKVPLPELVKGMNTCMQKMSVQQKMVEECQCFAKNGVNNMLPFCENLKKAEIQLEL